MAQERADGERHDRAKGGRRRTGAAGRELSGGGRDVEASSDQLY